MNKNTAIITAAATTFNLTACDKNYVIENNEAVVSFEDGFYLVEYNEDQSIKKVEELYEGEAYDRSTKFVELDNGATMRLDIGIFKDSRATETGAALGKAIENPRIFVPKDDQPHDKNEKLPGQSL